MVVDRNDQRPRSLPWPGTETHDGMRERHVWAAGELVEGAIRPGDPETGPSRTMLGTVVAAVLFAGLILVVFLLTQ
jgi:hypothetical protein